jgi:hypothetical protein
MGTVKSMPLLQILYLVVVIYRYIYIYSMIKDVVSMVGNERKLVLMYDVNCTFDKWLITADPELHSRIMSLAIPILHSYGHNAACQWSYNPRRKVGLGLADGEDCERLWSTLSNMVPVVKQTRDPVFKDLLSGQIK